MDKNEKRSDICIGLNKNYDEYFLNKSLELIDKFNYSVSINEPFSGSIVPSEFINDNRVSSIMIEIKKDIYSNISGYNKVSNLLESIYNM